MTTYICCPKVKIKTINVTKLHSNTAAHYADRARDCGVEGAGGHHLASPEILSSWGLGYTRVRQDDILYWAISKANEHLGEKVLSMGVKNKIPTPTTVSEGKTHT